jgi:hypothetical protein
VGFFQDVPQGRLTSGWRFDLIGASLERLARGRAALAFDGEGELLLEERSGMRIPEAGGPLPAPAAPTGAIDVVADAGGEGEISA